MLAVYRFRNAVVPTRSRCMLTSMPFDTSHDPGTAGAAARISDRSFPEPIRVNACEIRVGTAGWTDKTLTARGVFYPDAVGGPEGRLKYYASRLSIVEADAGFYAIPTRETCQRWVERTPDHFVFNVKAHALMTGHATEVARLPALIRDALPPKIAAQSRVYAKDLDRELRDTVWRLFRDAVEPLRESGKLGAVLLQFAPWILPAKNTPAMLERAREGLRDLPIAVEFRHPSWLEPRLRERLWAQLRAQRMTFVVADTPPGTPTSLPIAPAVTTPELVVVRLHGRRSELWGAKEATVLEKYRYLYDREELESWIEVILELAEQTERVHVVFNNCYANYGTTNALEAAGVLVDGTSHPGGK
jgi:uncharacterized protein YecE (DUF72 family)